MADDRIQHELDDDADDDALQGAALGGAGGAAIGAAAGAAVGPAGAVIGAVVGGIAGALAGGAAVDAIDKTDRHEATVGIDDGTTRGLDEAYDEETDLVLGNRVPGVQTGGRAVDGTPDTRGIMEKTADALTGDRTDDETGRRV